MQSLIPLHDGTSIPPLGFGTYQVPPDQAAQTVRTALEVGYRHIDTAQGYRNEAGVGQGIRDSGLDRSQIYVTTKLNNKNHRRDDVLRSFDESLQLLGVETLDLFLIHWPLPTLYNGDFVSTWSAMAELVGQGRLTSVGVSNFEPEHLTRIIEETGVVPVVNQIEAHPHFGNERARAASRDRGIAVQAWSPLGAGSVLADEAITSLAADLGRTPAQVVLRWHVQRGGIVFPKTMSRERMAENLDVFEFSSSPEQMSTLTGLDRGEPGRTGRHPDTFAWV